MSPDGSNEGLSLTPFKGRACLPKPLRIEGTFPTGNFGLLDRTFLVIVSHVSR
jgi:hypothetical protein